MIDGYKSLIGFGLYFLAQYWPAAPVGELESYIPRVIEVVGSGLALFGLWHKGKKEREAK